MIWRKKSSFVFSLSVIIAVFVWAQMGMYLAHLMFGVSLKMNIFKFCLSLFKENSFYYFIMIIIMNILIAHSVLFTVIKTVQQFVLSRRFNNKIMSFQNIKLTDHIKAEYRLQNQNIIIVDHDQLMAFTLGFRRPLIVLSSALVRILDEHELEAVIEHETFHQKNYDSIKIFMLQIISQTLWFIPLTKWTYENYKITSELSADEYAIKQTGSELGLGSALLKLINNYFNDRTAPILAHFADRTVNYRLQQLVEPMGGIPVKLKTSAIVISIHVLLLFMSMTVLAIT